MMNIIETYPIYALLLANAALCAAAVLAILKFQRLLRSSARFWDSPTGSALQAQCDQSMFNQSTENQLASLAAALEQLEKTTRTVSVATSEKVPYDTAIRMAKAGASTEELVRNCGLSAGEANLYRRIHASSAA